MREIIQEFKNLWELDEKSVSRGDKRGKMTETEEKYASNINLWVVGGSSSVGMLCQEFQNLWDEDERLHEGGTQWGKLQTLTRS